MLSKPNKSNEKSDHIFGVVTKNRGELIIISDAEAYVDDKSVPKVLVSLVNTMNIDRSFRFAFDPSKLDELIKILEEAKDFYETKGIL